MSQPNPPNTREGPTQRAAEDDLDSISLAYAQDDTTYSELNDLRPPNTGA